MIHACNMSKDVEAEGITDYQNMKIYLSVGHTGVIRKQIIVQGKAAHAGAHPHKGINALNAANVPIKDTGIAQNGTMLALISPKNK